MGSCVSAIRRAQRKRKLQSQRAERAEDNLLLEAQNSNSFAIYIIDNKGEIEEFYDVEDTKIGEGSFGRVCKCFNRSTGAERAVKILKKVRRKSQLLAFKNELSTLKMMDHPHIVKLYEHFEDKKYMYMVMEYCAGQELFERLLEVGHFSENQTAIIMQQAFRGIYYMHTMSVVHRDLKIENFMFSNPGPVEANLIKIIDFGFARTFVEGEALTTKCGAPYFVSPQVLAGKYTEAADMWTLGTIMYILLCGYPPFYGDSDAEILSRVRVGTFSFNDADWRHVSDSGKDLIRALLRMSERERFSAKQALFDEWTISKTPVLRAPLKPKYFENMRKYASFSKFKQASLQIIVSQLESELLKPLIDTFMWLDESGEGLISADEIEAGMKRAGFSDLDIPDDLDELVNALDSDGSGEIGLGEFVASCLDLQVYAREAVCWATFRIYDQNGDSMIGVTDLHLILNNGQPGGEEVVSARECKQLIAEHDEDGDRRISFPEFMNMMKGTTVKQGKGKDGKRQSARLKNERILAAEQATASAAEPTAEPMAGPPVETVLPPPPQDTAFESLDANGDGVITKEEIMLSMDSGSSPQPSDAPTNESPKDDAEAQVSSKPRKKRLSKQSSLEEPTHASPSDDVAEAQVSSKSRKKRLSVTEQVSPEDPELSPLVAGASDPPVEAKSSKERHKHKHKHGEQGEHKHKHGEHHSKAGSRKHRHDDNTVPEVPDATA